jgi:hypothetical protein
MNLGTKRHLVLYLAALPLNLFVWPMILFVRLLWGENLRWENRRNHIRKNADGSPAPGGPVLVCDIREGSWPVNPSARWPGGWYLIKAKNQQRSHPRTWGGTTLGHGIFYGPGRSSPGAWTRLEEHEGVHVEQIEAAMLRGLVTGAAIAGLGQSSAFLVVGLVVWATASLQEFVANWTTAWLRGEDPYRGSAHEEAAYALDELYEQSEQKETK